MTGGRVVVGLISDTHGHFRPQIRDVFSKVDLIVHAGDVGRVAVLDALRDLAPVYAVSGNDDDRHDPMLPRQRTLPLGNLLLHVSHGDELGSPKPDLLLARYDADIIVYGHTHTALMVRADDGRLVVNPGAAGPSRFKLEASVAVLTVDDGGPDVQFHVLD